MLINLANLRATLKMLLWNHCTKSDLVVKDDETFNFNDKKIATITNSTAVMYMIVFTIIFFEECRKVNTRFNIFAIKFVNIYVTGKQD